MNFKFPYPNPSVVDTTHLVGDKLYKWDGEKWDLVELRDTYTNKKPSVVEETPEVGVGRTIHHSFTITELEHLETL